MLEGTRRVLAEGRPHAGIELLFTPKEEVGLNGAYAFDHTRLQARTGYVYDQAAPIGTVILGAPFSQAIQVTFHGRAAHSGMHPEDGRSAIAFAAAWIAERPSSGAIPACAARPWNVISSPCAYGAPRMISPIGAAWS